MNKSQWISIKDSLPVEGVPVLAGNKDYYGMYARSSNCEKLEWVKVVTCYDGTCKYGNPITSPLFRVTHWMSLPDPIKDEATKEIDYVIPPNLSKSAMSQLIGGKG